jgi:hypothetical protein
MGPGEYVKDPTAGITDPKDLPPPITEKRKRKPRKERCPRCRKKGYRDNEGRRTLHDLGDLDSGRPRDLQIRYGIYRCDRCEIYFNADMTDLAAPGSRYTHRVVGLAVRKVIEDGLPLRAASWSLWRDHRVFVPWSTIQNWVDAAGEKRQAVRREAVPGLGFEQFLRLRRHRRAVRG